MQLAMWRRKTASKMSHPTSAMQMLRNADLENENQSSLINSLAIIRCFVNPRCVGARTCQTRRRDHQSRRCLTGDYCYGRPSIYPAWWRRFILHACILEHVGPFTARSLVAVLQVLPEVISAEELFGLVALPKLVHMVQMFSANIPLRRVWEVLPTVATYISAVG